MLRALLFLLILVPSICSAGPHAIIRANNTLQDTFRAQRVFAPEASRSLALAHLAAWDATVNAPVDEVDARAALAMLAVAEKLYPQQTKRYDELRESITFEDVDLRAATDAADAILAERADDGWDKTVRDPASQKVGQWRQTRPCFRPMLDPQWAFLKPFAMERPDAFRPPPPPALDSTDYAQAWEEVKRVGAFFSEERGAYDSLTARFWADELGSPTTPGRWNKIATDLAIEENFSSERTVELLTVLNIAMADAAIIAWDAKLYYNGWRPVTAIRLADTDGNATTEPDLRWSSYIKSPPFPEYPSGHATLSGAAQTVLESWFGTERSFVHSNHDLPLQYHQGAVIRRYGSIAEAAEEAAESRLLGGIHFRFSNQAGLDAGRLLGKYVLESWPGRNAEEVPISKTHYQK